MKKIRIGNDIRVEWTLIAEDGSPYIPRDTARIALCCGMNRIPITDFTVDENVITFTFFGKDQKHVGCYSMLIIENDGERDMVTFDTAGAFQLVYHSWQTGGEDCCGRIKTEYVTITSSMMMTMGPPGKSAYEIAVEHGFVGTEEEWLASLVGPPGSSDITRESIETALGYTPADEADLAAKYEKPAGGIPLTDLKVLRVKNVNLWIDDGYPYVPLSDLFHDVADLQKVCGPTSIYDVAYTDRFTPKNGSSIDLGETEIFQPRTLLIMGSYQRNLLIEGKSEYSFSLWSQIGYTIRYTVTVAYGATPQAGDLAKVEITKHDYRAITARDIQAWNAKSDFSGSYDDLTGKPDLTEFVTRSVNDLLNYYTKQQTYSQAEVRQLISAVQQFTYEVVASLPEASASTMGKIYLVPSSGPQAGNVKDEFITIDNGAEAQTRYTWERIGSTSIDLSDYVTTETLDNALADYLDAAEVNSLLAGKQPLINAQNKLDYSLLSNTPVFYATYGSTTAEEIQAAYNAGKIVLCLYNTAVYALANINDIFAHFGVLYGANAKWVRVLVSNNRWETGLQSLEVITNRVTLLDASATDTKYPTAKAVVDYVDGIVGDIETILAAI